MSRKRNYNKRAKILLGDLKVWIGVIDEKKLIKYIEREFSIINSHGYIARQKEELTEKLT